MNSTYFKGKKDISDWCTGSFGNQIVTQLLEMNPSRIVYIAEMKEAVGYEGQVWEKHP